MKVCSLQCSDGQVSFLPVMLSPDVKFSHCYASIPLKAEMEFSGYAGKVYWQWLQFAWRYIYIKSPTKKIWSVVYF